METDEYQPVEGVEAQSLRRGAPQDNDLLTQGQVLGFNSPLTKSRSPDFV
jgi:hypothetical protein